MKKKVNIFGKSVPVLVIALMSLALVSAALVPYLSGAVSGAFATQSPLTLEISENGNNWAPTDGRDVAIDLNDLHGGEITTFYLKVTNNADLVVVSDLLINIESNYSGGDGIGGSDGATCADFSNIVITGTKTVAPNGPITIPYYDGSLIGLAVDGIGDLVDDINEYQLCDDISGQVVITLPSVYLVDEVEEYQIDATAELAIAPSTYTITAQEMVATFPN